MQTITFLLVMQVSHFKKKVASAAIRPPLVRRTVLHLYLRLTRFRHHHPHHQCHITASFAGSHKHKDHQQPAQTPSVKRETVVLVVSALSENALKTKKKKKKNSPVHHNFNHALVCSRPSADFTRKLQSALN